VTAAHPPSWFLLQSGPGEAGFNMAMDEALLEGMPRLGKPVLRFYSWSEPAASFGYFQKFREIEEITRLRPLVRRPTGGGVVPHAGDWTYSLAFPTGDEWYSLTATESYRRVHEWIRDAFTRLKVATELAATCRKAEAGQCFVGHEKFDLLWRGQKIAGAAQRRTRNGLLIQGSVQPPPISVAKADWQKAMCDAAHFGAGVRWVEFVPDTPLNERGMSLAEQKYSLISYQQKR
jgi:lipoate-protein ligase A